MTAHAGGFRRDVNEVGLDWLDLSTRTANCCHNAGITTLGGLAALSGTDIMKWPCAGRKTLAEIRGVLGSVGLKLRDDMFPTGRTNPALLNELQCMPPVMVSPMTQAQELAFLLESATEDQQKSLVIPVKNLPLSVRAQNILIRFDAKHLGDIVQLSRGNILKVQNSGAKTLAELQSLVESHGFQLGMPISDWSNETVANVIARLKNEIDVSTKERSNRLLAAIGPSPRTLEGELRRIVRAFENERNSDVLLKLWGWSGSDPRVLESVGQEYGLTRERVRQIESRAIKRVLAHQFDFPFVHRAIQEVTECVPMRDSDISERLKATALSEEGFSVWGLKKAAEIFSIPWPFETLVLRGERLLTGPGEEILFRRAFIKLRKRTSDRGLTNVAALAAEVGLRESRSSALRLFLDIGADVTWLDEAKDWAFLPEVQRNRLRNLCSKVFSVSREIRIAELRRAVGKSRRLAMVPPQRILAAFVERARLATVTDDIARVIPGAVGGLAEDSVEANMLKVLDEHGPVMDGEQFARRCVEAGINATSFFIYRLISPVITSLGKGVYCKVGTNVPPGTIEDIVARRIAAPRVSDHGWTSNGRLWFGMELSMGTITAGGIRLPSFVSDFAQGEWEVVLPDQSTCGMVTGKGIYIHSFRRAFGLLGAEPTDLAAFEFDLNRRCVHVRVGGAGLFEQIEDPESVQAESANDDDNEV